MKKQTTTPPKSQGAPDRWTAAVRGKVEARRLGTPKGELTLLFQMEAEWARIPNSCFEDEAGQLWLAHAKLRAEPVKIDTERGYEAVTGKEFLEWLHHVLEFVDGYDGDPVDICRIALAELARRSDLARVQRAVMEDRQAGFKPRRARKEKR